MNFVTFLLSQIQTVPLSNATEGKFNFFPRSLSQAHNDVSERFLVIIKHLKYLRADFSQMCCLKHDWPRFCKALITVSLSVGLLVPSQDPGLGSLPVG